MQYLINQIKNIFKIIFFLTFIFSLFISGCKTAEEVKKVDNIKELPIETIKPAITFKIATIDLSRTQTRYSKKSIHKLAKDLQDECIDILIIQSVTRYPELKNRVDLLKELKNFSEMNYKFLELENTSGRLVGNALFSIYPIQNYNNEELVINGKKFLLMNTSIDIGIPNILIVTLPSVQIKTDAGFKILTDNLINISNNFLTKYFIAVGNIFKNSSLSIRPEDEIDVCIDSFLYKKSIKLEKEKVKTTDLGKLIICEFGVYQNTNN